MNKNYPNRICAVSNEELPHGKVLPARYVRPGVWTIMQNDHKQLTREDYISKEIVHKYRMKYLEKVITEERGTVSNLEKDVLNSLDDDTLLSQFNGKDKVKYTFGQKLADKIASFGGSWTFIISFLSFIMIWIAINVFLLVNKGWDPYPFILLNLILSCLAALQAPVIMMSQNRQEEKDRERAEGDYKVNLKAELEIRLLNDKIDYMLQFIDKRDSEIQEIQVGLLDEIVERLRQKDEPEKPTT